MMERFLVVLALVLVGTDTRQGMTERHAYGVCSRGRLQSQDLFDCTQVIDQQEKIYYSIKFIFLYFLQRENVVYNPLFLQ